MKETLRFAMSKDVDNPPDGLSTNVVLLDVAVEEKQSSLMLRWGSTIKSMWKHWDVFLPFS